jgi:hypothetical protein
VKTERREAACLDDDQVAALVRRVAILRAGGLTLVHKPRVFARVMSEAA